MNKFWSKKRYVKVDWLSVKKVFFFLHARELLYSHAVYYTFFFPPEELGTTLYMQTSLFYFIYTSSFYVTDIPIPKFICQFRGLSSTSIDIVFARARVIVS